MLPKENRITSGYDFRRIRSRGASVRSPYFNFFFLKEGDAPKFGFVTSVKLHKKAAKRNRVKRLVRQTVEECMPNIKQPVSGVFYLKDRSLTTDFGELKKAVERVFREAGVV